MNAEQLLLEIRRTLHGRDPEHPTVRRRLQQIANRAGAAELLLDTLRRGEIGAAHIAAMALPFARSELVRRGLQRSVRQESGERRAVFLAALTDEELEKALAEMGETLAEDLVHASGILAVNSPSEFIDLVCSNAPMVDEAMFAHLERVRETFGVGAASLYGPLLERRLTPEARRRAVEALGREPGAAARRLLDREHDRATADEDLRLLRRERMRQSSIGLGGLDASRHGAALLSPLGPNETAVLELIEELEPGRCLRTTVVFGLGGALDRFTVPAAGNLDAVVGEVEAGLRWGRLELGQARSLLEGLRRKQRDLVRPVLERLSAVDAVELPWPAPAPGLELPAARDLVRDPLWAEWRPFARVVEWPDEAIESTGGLAPERFPGELALTAAQAAQLSPDLLRERGVRPRLAAGLRHMALVMSLRGDARAGAVAAAAAWAARRRPCSLVVALVERELWLQLWTHARLPFAYRSQVRDAVRARLSASSPKWEDVQRLDLAQAAAEGMARAAGEVREDGRLPPVAELDLDAALQLADRARATFADASLRRRARGGRFEVVAEAARGWLDEAPPQAAFEVAQLLATTCLDGCPHDCFSARPVGRSALVLEGDNPRDVLERAEVREPPSAE